MTSLNPEFQTQFDQGRKPQHVVYQFCLAFFLSIKIITINQKVDLYESYNTNEVCYRTSLFGVLWSFCACRTWSKMNPIKDQLEIPVKKLNRDQSERGGEGGITWQTWDLKKKPQLSPIIIVSTSANGTFQKGSHYGCRMIKVCAEVPFVISEATGVYFVRFSTSLWNRQPVGSGLN